MAGRRRGRVERRVVREDRLLEPLQLGPGLHADLLHERVARLPVRVERLGLTLGAIEREHPLGVQPFAQRVVRDERLELADHVGMPPGFQVCFDRQLVRVHAELVEPADLGGGERLVGDVGQRFPPPECERLARPRLVDQPREPSDVDRLGGNPELVVAAVRDDRGTVAVQESAQLRHVELHHLRSARWRLLAPQPLREPVGRHRPVGLEAEHRQKRALLAGAEDDGAVAEASLDGPEELEIHAAAGRVARAYSRSRSE